MGNCMGRLKGCRRRGTIFIYPILYIDGSTKIKINKNNMKKKVGLIISLVVIATSLMFSLQANAETVGCGGGGAVGPIVGPFPVAGEIALQQGWNIVSTPRLVESHQFSASST